MPKKKKDRRKDYIYLTEEEEELVKFKTELDIEKEEAEHTEDMKKEMQEERKKLRDLINPFDK